jgi:hypothetical protein
MKWLDRLSAIDILLLIASLLAVVDLLRFFFDL